MKKVGRRLLLFARRALVWTALTAIPVGLFVLVLYLMDYHWIWKNVWSSSTVELMANGLFWTLVVSLGSMVIGIVLGVAAGLGRMSRKLVPRHYATLYVELIRGTPLLVQIFVVFYCIDNVARINDKVVLGILALGTFSGAYIAEVVRAGVESVPRGQMEAARSLGMTHAQAMLHVVGPQAFRNALPPLAGQFISLVKDSSLLYVVGVTELLKRADQVYSSTWAPFEVYLPLAGLYLLLTLPLSRCTQKLELVLGGERRRIRL